MKGDRHVPRPVDTPPRGQTTFDFAIGVSVFLVVVVAVVAFVPTMSPGGHDPGEGDKPIAAERAAEFLVEDAFASAETPYRFDDGCLVAFFDDRDACGFGSDNPVAEDLGIRTHWAANVTVEADTDGDGTREFLCWTGTGVVNESACGGGDTLLTAGSSAALNEEFGSASRAGRVGNRRVFVVVRTW